jgi:3-deoxy-D-manno-octulosonic-acid transferase
VTVTDASTRRRSMGIRSAFVDVAYASAAAVSSPLWLWRMGRAGKLRTDWAARFGHVEPPLPAKRRPRLLLHAVSVGEVNAIRLLVAALAAERAAPEIVVATTTDTGFARAQAIFAPAHRVVRYPFDVSQSVRRFLDSVDPDVVALVELEVWPNFTAACAERGIPVTVLNGRLSERSFRRYRAVRPVIRPSFARLAAVSAQNDAYAERFRALGTASGAVLVGGTMKWDTAEIADDVPGSAELAADLGIDRTRPLVVAGSTAPGEEALIDRSLPPGAQLLVAPRKPEWFTDAAAALPGSVCRSAKAPGSPTGRFVLDTIGELRKAYALADLVVIGRSFGRLHGSDMMEPIALGKATVVGPRTGDFRETMDALLAWEAIRQVEAHDLPAAIAALLNDPARRQGMAERGRAVIRERQGATRRNAELLISMLARRDGAGS